MMIRTGHVPRTVLRLFLTTAAAAFLVVVAVNVVLASPNVSPLLAEKEAEWSWSEFGKSVVVGAGAGAAGGAIAGAITGAVTTGGLAAAPAAGVGAVAGGAGGAGAGVVTYVGGWLWDKVFDP